MVARTLWKKSFDYTARSSRAFYRFLPSQVTSVIYPLLHPIARYLDDSFLISQLPSLSADPRLPYFERVFQTVAVDGVEGDYLEFGVFYGRTVLMALTFAETYKLDDMRLFGFDSFAGFPYNEGPSTEKRASSSVGLFNRYISSQGKDPKKVTLIEGIYSDSLKESVKTKNGITSAAIVHIDCDQYLSTRDVLQFIQDLVHQGTILIFDDWDSFDEFAGADQAKNYGEQKAFEEWCLQNRFQEFYHSGERMAFIMV